MRTVATSYPAIGVVDETVWVQSIELPQASGVIEIHSSYQAARELGITTLGNIRRVLESHPVAGDILALLRHELPHEVVSLLLIIPKGDKLSLLRFGEGTYFLRRANSLMRLVQKEGVVTGQSHIGDVLFAVTGGALKRYAKELPELFSHTLSPKEVAQAVSLVFGNTVDDVGKGVLVFEVQSFAEEGSQPVPVLPSFVEKSKRFPKPFSVKSLIFILRRFFTRENIKKYRFIIIACIVGLFFLGSVYLGIRRQMNDKTYQGMIAAYEQSNALFTQAVATMQIDEGKSRDLFIQARDKLSPYISKTMTPGKESRNIKDLQDKITDNLSIVARVYKREMALFYDASFLRSDRVVDQMILHGNTLYIMDTTQGMLASVAVDSKNATLLAGGDSVIQASSFAADDTQVFLLTPGGVQSVTEKSGQPKTVIPKTAIDDSPETVTTFGSNVYLLSKQTGKLWRYVKGETSGFGKGSNYFAEDVTPDLQNVTNIAIDGSVWMGSTLGKLFKYTQGRDDPFLIRGVDPPLGSDIYVSTDGDALALYILDSANKRLVVVSKEGGYLGQYTWPDSTPITGFAVSEAKKRAFFVMGKKIYSFALQ